MENVEDCIVGIDLGTTNSLVGVVDSGFPIVLADSEGRRLVPSVVSWQKDEVLTGERARRSANLHPESTAASVKRFVGRRFSDLPGKKSNNIPARWFPVPTTKSQSTSAIPLSKRWKKFPRRF